MKSRPDPLRIAYRVLTAFLGIVLLVAGTGKVLHPEAFALAVYRFHLLPGACVNAAAVYLAWLEVTCGLCLLFIPPLRAGALRVTLGLLMIFTVAVGVNLVRGSSFGCGCFHRGLLERPIGMYNLARNLVLITAAILALRFESLMSGSRSDG